MHMKSIILTIAFFGLLITFTSCKEDSAKCNLISVKVLRYDCDRVILQFLSKDFIGDNAWEDQQTGQRYDNVASYYNTCKIAEITQGEKIVVYVSLKELKINPTNIDCAQCTAISQNPPNTTVDFSGIYKTNCETNYNN